MNAHSSIATALSCFALVAAAAACSASPVDRDTGSARDDANTGKAAEADTLQPGPTTLAATMNTATMDAATTDVETTATVTARSTTGCDGAGQSTLEAEGAGEQFVAATTCGAGLSLRPYRANACRVGVTSAGTGDTITAHDLGWSILGRVYKCTITRSCSFNAADGPGCGAGGEPAPPNSYCNQTFPSSETETQYWGRDTIPSGYTAISWCQEKYTERAAAIQASAVTACNAEATQLANGTRRDMACCVPTATLTSASTTLSTIL